MKIIISLTLALVALVACRQQVDSTVQKTDTSVVTDTVAFIKNFKNIENVETKTFFEIDTCGILMFPLTLSQADADRDSYGSSRSEGSYWNIIFYNSKTKEYHLLNESKKAVIWNYEIRHDEYNSSTSDVSFTPNIHLVDGFIFYRVTITDFNRDQKLNRDDPTYLFISDKEGNNFRQISPDNCDLLSYEYIKASHKLLMNVRADNNNNKKFEDIDETSTFEIVINKNTKPTEVFSAGFKNKLKLLYQKTWLHK